MTCTSGPSRVSLHVACERERTLYVDLFDHGVHPREEFTSRSPNVATRVCLPPRVESARSRGVSGSLDQEHARHQRSVSARPQGGLARRGYHSWTRRIGGPHLASADHSARRPWRRGAVHGIPSCTGARRGAWVRATEARCPTPLALRTPRSRAARARQGVPSPRVIRSERGHDIPRPKALPPASAASQQIQREVADLVQDSLLRTSSRGQDSPQEAVGMFRAGTTPPVRVPCPR